MKFWRKPIDADEYIVPQGEIHILSGRCKGCGFCIEFCPKSALVSSPVFNEKGYHPPQKIEEVQCVTCGLCELICPEFAIFTKRINEENGKE